MSCTNDYIQFSWKNHDMIHGNAQYKTSYVFCTNIHCIPFVCNMKCRHCSNNYESPILARLGYWRNPLQPECSCLHHVCNAWGANPLLDLRGRYLLIQHGTSWVPEFFPFPCTQSSHISTSFCLFQITLYYKYTLLFSRIGNWCVQ